MATLRDLKGRIGSVGSSEKITGAMKMISSAKMHKAESALRKLVPYKQQIKTIISHLLSADASFQSELIEERDVHKYTIVVFGSDDGLCGAYNIQVFKSLVIRIAEIREKYGPNLKIRIFPIGKKIAKAAIKLENEGIEVILHGTLNTKSTLDDIKHFVERLQSDFLTKEADKVEIVYTHFMSVSKQNVVAEQFLPISYSSLEDGEEKNESNKPYLFEPDANGIFNMVLPLYVLSNMQEIASENIASEQASRVMAMQSANDNAKKLLEDLQLEYNKLRQQGIKWLSNLFKLVQKIL